MGNFVLGAVIEGGRSEARDSVSGFSTTPASYTMSSEADYQANARLRAGYTQGGGALFYVKIGRASCRARVCHDVLLPRVAVSLKHKSSKINFLPYIY